MGTTTSQPKIRPRPFFSKWACKRRHNQVYVNNIPNTRDGNDWQHYCLPSVKPLHFEQRVYATKHMPYLRFPDDETDADLYIGVDAFRLMKTTRTEENYVSYLHNVLEYATDARSVCIDFPSPADATQQLSRDDARQTPYLLDLDKILQRVGRMRTESCVKWCTQRTPWIQARILGDHRAQLPPEYGCRRLLDGVAK